MIDIEALKFDEKGLIPVVVQNYKTNDVLMLAYADRQALRETLRTREVHFFSRSRQQLWHKGATSGNILKLVTISADCDCDALLISAEPMGPACHTGSESCFFNEIARSGAYPEFSPGMLFKLYETVRQRKAEPVEGSYTNYLFDSGIDKILKKIGEEAAEVIIASKNASAEEIIYETSDLLYHLIVLLNEREVEFEEVLKSLGERHSNQRKRDY